MLAIALVTILSLYTAEAESLYNQAVYLMSHGKLGDAEVVVQEALAVEPGDPSLLLLLGEIFRREGKLDEAEEVLTEAVSANPRDARPYIFLAVVNLEKEKLEKAKDFSRMAFELSHGDDTFLVLLSATAYNLGVKFYEREEYEKALTCFRIACDADSRNSKAHISLGYTALKLGELDEALKIAGECVSRWPANPNAHLFYVKCLVFQNRASEALPLLAELVKKFPKNRDIHIYAAELNLAFGRDSVALQILKDIQSSFPRDTAIHRHILKIYEKMGDYRGALEECRNFISLNPEAVESYWEAYKFASELGDTEECIRILKKATRAFPDDVAFKKELAFLLEDVNPKDALEFYLSLPLEPFFIFRTGVVLEKMGDTTQALEYFRKAVKCDINDPYPYYKLAVCLDVSSKKDSILSLLRKAVEKGIRVMKSAAFTGLAGLKRSRLHVRSYSMKGIRAGAQVSRAIVDSALLRLESLMGIAFEDYFRELAMEHRDVPYLRVKLAEFLVKRGKYGEAEKHLGEALRKNPKDLRAHLDLAEVYEKQGKLDAALMSYRRIIELDSKNEKAYERIISLCRKTGRKDEVLESLRTKLKREEDNEILRHCIELLENMGGE